MDIQGLQKMTLLDWPGKVACTVFLGGCDFRCPFCHNSELLSGPMPILMDQEGLLEFLRKRQGLLDGVCVTGGEPLLRPGLPGLLDGIKNLGFPVKLDTNGNHPDRLVRLWEQGLVDYVAMDVKNAPERYEETVGVDGLDLARVRESVSFLLEGSVPYEFRTTVVRELHAESDLRSLAEWIAGAEAWFLQSFIDEESVLGGTGRFHAWEPDELRHILPELQRIVPTAALRGIDP